MNGLKFMGKDPDGNARGVSVERNGILKHHNSLIIPVSDLVQLSIPTYDGSGQCVHPSVVYVRNKLSGYKYWMAFTPYPGLNSDYENPSIVASNDGINWVVPAGLTNPVVPKPADRANADSTLIWDGTTLHLYWIEIGGSTYKKTSTDGITWSAKTPTVNCSIKRGMYYDKTMGTFNSLTTLDSVIGWQDVLIKRFSKDGVNFYDKFARPVLTTLSYLSNGGEGHGSAYADGAGVHFLENIDGMLFYGYSLDGNRAIFDPSPVLTPTTGKFCDRTLYTSCIVPYEDGTYMIYASGFSHDNKSFIGCMRVRLNLAGLDFGRPLKRGFTRTLFDNYELRDTSTRIAPAPATLGWPVPEFNDYLDKTLTVHSNLNQPVKIFLTRFTYFLNDAYATSQQTFGGQADEYVFQPNGNDATVLDKTAIKGLGVIYPYTVGAAIKAVDVAPTSGAITIMLSGC
jgi:hypothetical protein